jgi:hypothetical protein
MKELSHISILVHRKQIVKALSFMMHVVKSLIIVYSYSIKNVIFLTITGGGKECTTNYLKREALERLLLKTVW